MYKIIKLILDNYFVALYKSEIVVQNNKTYVEIDQFMDNLILEMIEDLKVRKQSLELEKVLENESQNQNREARKHEEA